MSSSYLIGIKSDYTAKILASYENSWLFSPVVWDSLTEKYIPDVVLTPNGKKGIIGPYNEEVWTATNDKVNTSRNLADRICWEMTNQQIFFTKDQRLVSQSILAFLRQNREYGILAKNSMHIISRFRNIAGDMAALGEEYPFFVFKNNSLDNTVENWFEKNENGRLVMHPLYEKKEFVTEFVVIENGSIRFIRNIDYEYGNKAV